MDERSLQSRIDAMHPPEMKTDQLPIKSRSEELLKNLAVASCLVLSAVALKSGALPVLTPAADAVVSAMTDDTLLDDQLGKLSFVSSLFPEATLVFGQADEPALALPVNAGYLVHAWSENEPYAAWRSETDEVYACAGGTVMGIYHGTAEEKIVQTMDDHGQSCIYGNLQTTSVQAGDYVEKGAVIGRLLTGADCILEVRENGISVDPLPYLDSSI